MGNRMVEKAIKGLYSNVGVIGVVDMKEVRKKLNLKDYEFKKRIYT